MSFLSVPLKTIVATSEALFLLLIILSFKSPK